MKRIFLVIFLLGLHSNSHAADDLLSAGTQVSKSNLCTAAMTAVGLQARSFKVIRANNLDDLDEFTGKKVRILRLHDSKLLIPGMTETRSYGRTFQSVYGGPQDIYPPFVGAFYVIDRRQNPLRVSTTTREPEYVGTKTVFQDSDGRKYMAYRHPKEADMIGVIQHRNHEFFGLLDNYGNYIYINSLVTSSREILLVTEI
jgi:hypothetical protein